MKKTKAFSTLLILMLLISLFTAPSAYAVSDPPNNLSALVNSSTHPYFRADGTYVMPVYTNVSEIIKDGKYYVEYTNKDGTVDVYGPNDSFYQNDYGEWIMTGDGRPSPKEGINLNGNNTKSGDFIIDRGTDIGYDANGKYFSKSVGPILIGYTGKGGTVVVPSNIKIIYDGVFDGRKDITNVVLPEGLEKIEGGFALTGIKTLVIPSTVKYVQSIDVPHDATQYNNNFNAKKELENVIVLGKGTVFNTWNQPLWNGKAIIYGYAGKDSEPWKFTHLDGYAYSFKSLDQAPIAKGTLTLDTANYTTAPGKSYQIGVSLTGYGAHINAYSDNSNTVKLNKLSNGNYQIKGIRSGTAYIMFDVLNSSNKKIAHASVKVTVKSGAKPYGDSHRQTLSF